MYLNVLVSLGLTAAVSATDAAIHKKIFGSGMHPLDLEKQTTLIMNDIMKIIRSLEESGLLIKGVSETIKNEAKEQKGAFLSMLLGNLGNSLLGNQLAGTIRAEEGKIRVGEATISAG